MDGGQFLISCLEPTRKQTNNNNLKKRKLKCIHIGDLKNEDSVLEWLSDDDNRELADEIEAVNSRMLERLLDESPFLAVYFCKYCACRLTLVANKREPPFPSHLCEQTRFAVGLKHALET